eukprot:jgi/Psemu1/290688/fgenesh1_pg.541_\
MKSQKPHDNPQPQTETQPPPQTQIQTPPISPDPIRLSLRDLQHHHIASTHSVLIPYTTVLVLVEPVPSKHRYPSSVTKHLFPPSREALAGTSVVYQDDVLAVVNKPENRTTIGNGNGNGECESDLQSILGFLLAPSPLDPLYAPRPVHRLDRRTSGLVVVAKTKATMRDLSKAFATRSVQKTYTALVFERDAALSSGLFANANAFAKNACAKANRAVSADAENVAGIEAKAEAEAEPWLVVDHPIEGKDSLSHVRAVTPMVRVPVLVAAAVTAKEAAAERFALVEVSPKTGRTHQIRRHLSYCLGMPIVGDSRYDGGGATARHLRTNGMYLCCHALRFPHTKGRGTPASQSQSQWQSCGENGRDEDQAPVVEWIETETETATGDSVTETSECELSIRIPLPAKFREWRMSQAD